MTTTVNESESETLDGIPTIDAGGIQPYNNGYNTRHADSHSGSTVIQPDDAGWQISKVSASADDILAGVSVGTSTSDASGIYAYQLSSYYNNTNYEGDHFRHADGHSKIIGFTFDGYPFYGLYAYDLSMDMTSTVVIMTSSYALRPEQQYYVYENGTIVDDICYNQPAVSTNTYLRIPYTNNSMNPTTDGIYIDSCDNVVAVYNGAFLQDYKYYPGTGHLDESNGRYCKTPDYPNGTYAYFLTNTYPGTMGNRPRNNLDTENTNTKQIKTTKNNKDLSLNTFNTDTNIPITDNVLNNIAISSITMAFDASYGTGYTRFEMSTDNSGNAIMSIKTDGDPYPMLAGVTNYTNSLAREGFGGGNEITSGEWKNSTMKYYGGLSEENSPKATATKTNDIYLPFGAVGVCVNGTAIYTQNAGTSIPPYGSGKDVSSPTGFYFNPVNFEDRYGIDRGAGHPTPGGEYHYHDLIFAYSVITEGLPDAPTDVVAVSGNASAKIYFTVPYDGGYAITSYRVDGDGTYYGSGTSSPITLTGLTNGTIYSFYVRSINENGTSDNSTTVSVDVGTPTEPTSVVATPGNGFITISFTAPDSSGGAIITRYFVYDSTGNIDASGTSTSIRVSGLTNGQSYSYYVAAINIYGTGTSSSTVTAIAGTPGIPTNVVALAGNAYIDISFTAPSSNGGSTITNYIVYDEDGNIDASGLDSPIRITGLTNGQSYSYYVAAENANGIGQYSSTVSATPVSTTTVPSEPTNVSAVAGNSFIDVSFSAPTSDGGSPITNYIVYDPSGNIDASGLDSPIRITGLTNGQSYSYYIAAENQYGIGQYSPTVSGMPYSVPSEPTNVSAVAGDTYIDVSFSAPTSDGGSPITNYIVYDPSGNIDASGLDSPIRITGLTNGQSYSYYIAAENQYGIGAYSPTVSGMPYSVPSEPTNVSAVAGNSFIDVSFSAPTSDGGSPIINYIVYDPSGNIDASGLDSPIRITGLTNGQSYSYYVAAENQYGIGEYSPTVSGMPYSVPSEPINVVAVAGNSFIDISFSVPTSDGGSPIINYIVYDPSGNIDASGLDSPIRVSGLTNGLTYSYYIAAENQYGIGEYSSTVSATPYTVPSEPTNVSAVAGNSFIDVSFSAPTSDGGSPIINYIVYDPSGNIDASGLDSPIRITGLTNGQSYSYYVAAENQYGIGEYSPTVSGMPYGAPYAPTNVIAIAGNAYIDLYFSEPNTNSGSVITNYIVYDTNENIDASGLDSPIRLSGLTNGLTYSYYIAAVNEYGIGQYSPTVSGIPYNVPTEPTDVTTLAGDTYIDISFSAPISDGGYPITNYIVYDTSGNIDASGLDSPIRVSELTNGETYYFKLAASTIIGIGSYSSIVSGIPYSVPSEPTSVYTVAGNGYIDVYFTAPISDGGSPITNYIVYDTSSNIDASGLDSPIRISGLTNGETYSYYVAAKNASGIGPYSSVVSATPYTVPGAPRNAIAISGNSFIDVSFTAPISDGGSPITNYIVYDTSGNIDASGLDSPIRVSGLTNGETYSYYVTAKNASGIGPYSSAVSATPYTIPGAPRNAIAISGNSFIDVSFSAPSSNGGSPITNYIVYDTSGNIDASGSSSPIRISGLTNGETYSYYVAAKNASGIGPYSNEVYAFPYTVPGAPSILNVSSSNQSLTVSFSPPTYNGSSDILSYIAYAKYSGMTTTGTGSSSSSSITISGLINGSRYVVSVSAINNAGTGASSSIIYAVPFTVPDAPTIISSTAGDSYINILFSTPSWNGGSKITGYIVVDSNDTEYASGTSSPLVVSGLTNGTTYTFYVKASNIAGSGARSDAITTYPYALPYAPTDITTSVGDGYIDVSFSAPTETGGYPIIYYNISDNDTIDVSGTSSPIRMSGLTKAVEYTFYIKAYNQYGPGSSTSFIGILYAVPDAPSINSAISENATGRIYFTVPNNNGSEITSYRVVDSDGTQYSTNNSTKSPIIIYNLTNGTSYTFYLIAVNAAGTSANSSSFNINPYTTPSAPTITNTVSGNNYIDISFSEPTSNGGIPITQYNIINSPGNKVTTGTTSPIRVSNLVNGTIYTFKIAAKNSAGIGSYSTDVSAISYTTPDAPTITKINAWNSSVDIYFSPPENNGGLSITSYNVYDTTNQLTRTGFINSPITLSNLINNTTYSFFMKAVNSAGSGTSSDISNATPKAVPFAPTIITAGAGSNGGSANIFFDTPSDNGGFSITGYIATSNPDGIIGNSLSSPIIIQNLRKGIPYNFTVQAQNINGTGSPSTPSSVVVPIGVPDPPIITSLLAGNRSVTIGFNPPLNTGGLPILRYIARSIPENIEVSGNVPNITVSNLTNGTSYTFILSATNAFGTSQYSLPSGTVIPFTIPDPPTGIAIDNGNRRADVYYTNPMNTGGNPITGYLVRDLSNQIIKTGSSSPIAIDRLANGQLLVNGRNYTFSLSVVNAAGPSSSSIFNFIPMTTPNAPNITNVASGFGYADIVFNPPSNNGGSDILYYTVYLGELEIIGYTSPIRIPDLLNGSSYMIRLSATNAAGTGSSTANYPFTMSSSVPGPPTITELVPGNGYVDITLEPPVNTGGSTIIGYKITSTPQTTIHNVNNVLTYQVSGLTNGTSYTFTINARNNIGLGEAIVSESVIPYTVPDAPAITNIVASDESVVITFDPPSFNGGSDILDYSVYYTGSDITGSSVIASSETTIYGFTNDVAYTFRMVARNAAGFSAFSESFGPITPKSEKIDYCVKQSCVKAQYSTLKTGGNDPKLTKAMRYSQLLSSRKPKTGFL